MKNKINIKIVGGPTATGKTNYAIKLAKAINGEIINADSVQVYKHLNIGANKGSLKLVDEKKYTVFEREYTVPTVELENSGIYGQMFNVVNPDEEFNIATYQSLTKLVINEIVQSGKIPILVGGSGLYIDAIIKNYDLAETVIDLQFRKYLNSLSKDKLQEILLEESEDILESLNNSDKNNPRRLIRLIEKQRTSVSINNKSNDDKYNFQFYYPIFNKKSLETKIDNRVIEMFKEGLVSEVEQLKKWNYNNKAFQSAGYKQIVDFLQNEKTHISIDECIKEVQLSHKQLAKRQITWFEGKGRNYNLQRVNFLDEVSV